ncbi:flagellar basal-body MS-ring/collar protein FliF [Leifsonia shinshuensis]|uniref:flagellar basal-body MS-ring/collar protein FliF n=1 Tax=Leifsonia shinshuensis TaxID=150026 RepID=UPI00285FA4E8|nr:flagellar basal-body MS-ring/collar protein FliF [Leifsonia shinshuensis]MDR6972269.1 flagellar M-ring protein FliF [Leifsonia shinshuensis]
MPQQVTSFFRRIGDSIRGFSLAQRVIAIIGVAVVALGITGIAMWASQPSYTPLFSGVAASDASAIVDQLRTDNVPYQLTDGGSTILVPQEKVYDERLKAASAGLPASNTGGYSLLDKMGVTSSEFQQNVTYKRAMEGELGNTIAAMKGVKTASVRLAIPEETVFAADKKDPTASVFVETLSGVNLSADQVQAIVHLTSAAVPGMKPTDVAVVDADGTVLSTVGGGATGGADKQASDYETRVKAAVQDMLDKVVGAGNATVAVAADVSTESAQRTEESYTAPTDAPSLSETTQKETYTGSGAAGGAGVLGPDNIAVPNGTNGNGSFNSESSTKDNAVDKVTEQRTIPAGAINRQTVSVALNSDAVGGVSANEIRNLVNAAAGIDVKRGDSVSVEMVPFSKAGATEAAKAIKEAKDAAAADQLTSIIRTSLIAGAIVAAAIIAFALFRRGRRRAAENAELALDADSLALDASPFPIALEQAAPTVPMQLDPLPDPTPDPAEVEADRRRAEIEALAERDPHKTAEFLRSLMDDRAGV